MVALFQSSEVAVVRPGGTPRILLTSADGLSNPTSVEVVGAQLYVTSGAYLTQQNPNLLTAVSLPRP